MPIIIVALIYWADLEDGRTPLQTEDAQSNEISQAVQI